MTLQNEPHYKPPDYPGMRWGATEEADFVKNHLEPAFAANGITTKIVVWDHNWDEPSYPITVLNDPMAKASTGRRSTATAERSTTRPRSMTRTRTATSTFRSARAANGPRTGRTTSSGTSGTS